MSDFEQKNDRDEVVELFRDVMSEEISLPEVEAAKKEFISKHFSEEPVFSFRPQMLVPAFSLAAVLMLAINLSPFLQQQGLESKPVVQQAHHEQEAPVVKEAVTEKPEPTIISSTDSTPVHVSRVYSDVGSTMVFQRQYQDASLTVVWVFPGGV